MHIKGKVYDITKENMNRLIDELEQTQDKLKLAIEALERCTHIFGSEPIAFEALKEIKGEK